MNKCLLSRPGLIAGPLHSTPLQIISQSIPRLDPIDSKSSHHHYCYLEREAVLEARRGGVTPGACQARPDTQAQYLEEGARK